MSSPAPIRTQRYLTVILRALFTVIGFFGATMLAGRYVTEVILTKVYVATAQIEVRPITPVGGTALPGPDAGSAPVDVLRSPEFLLPVVRELDLKTKWKDRLYPTKDGLISDDEALARLSRMTSFKLAPAASVLLVSVTSDRPREAAIIANAVADHYEALRTSAGFAGTPSAAARELAVHVISRAVPPTVPVWPNPRVAFVITFILAIVVGIEGVCFTEMVCLFQRAGQRGPG